VTTYSFLTFEVAILQQQNVLKEIKEKQNKIKSRYRTRDREVREKGNTRLLVV
jgi:hypothetical protein